jgi:hypothetical protein
MTSIVSDTKPHVTSSYEMFSIIEVLTLSFDDASPLKRQRKFSMISTVVHAEVTYLACPLHKR